MLCLARNGVTRVMRAVAVMPIRKTRFPPYLGIGVVGRGRRWTQVISADTGPLVQVLGGCQQI